MEKRLHFTFFDNSVFIKSVIIICFLSFFSAKAFSQATVSTDQQDYAPGSTVYITGSGFAANETVTLQVLHVGGGDDLTSPAHQPWTVTADASGNISSTWYVPADEDEVGATLQLTATGQTSGIIAQTTFTDANTKLTVTAVTGTYGGIVNITATLTQSGGGGNGNPVPGKLITFKFGTTTINTTTTDASGNASLTGVHLTSDGTSTGTRIAAGSQNNFVSAVWAGDASFSGTTGTGNLTVSKLGITWSVTASDKIYDGSKTAAIVASPVGVLSGDVVSLTGATATFADKNVGNNKTVTATGASLVSGGSSGNYTLTNTSATTTASITPKSLTITATGINKTYDGTTTATVNFSDNKVSGDAIIDAYTAAAFTDKNVGAGKAVSVSGISFSGTDAGNYSLSNTTASTTANITAKALTVTATGVNKVYDGTTVTTVTLADNRISGDVFTDTYASASFATASAGANKTVNVTGISISGTDAANYSLGNTTATATATITPRLLTVTVTAANKVYDGTTVATVTPGDDRISGDKFNDQYASATFSDKNVANGKTVTVTGIFINGQDATNYTLANTTATATANITARALTVTAAGVNKVYDGTTAATVTLSDNKLTGDVVNDAYTTATFADKNVGTGKAVSVSGISISGADANNYSLANTTASTTADITVRTLTLTATGINKVYDGNMAATVTLSDDKVSGDAVTDAYTTATFADKNVGTGKTVSVSGISISGTDATNYSLSNTTASTTADITAKTLTVFATGVNKTYDGNTTATVTLSDNKVSGDAVTDAYTTATFSDKNVGTGKAVSVSGISISGTDANNYSLSNTTTSTTADITAKTLTVTATGVNKTYDGTTTATVTLSDNKVSGDAVTDAYITATFADKNVGTGKAVSVSGISISGADATNYSLSNTTTSTTADITAMQLTVTATGVNKTYDGTTTATVTLSDNKVSGDAVTDAYTTSTFADKNVGTGKAVSVSGISISGNDANNYSLSNTTASTTADITAMQLTVTATGVNKTYDGTATATVTLSDNKVSGDAVTDAYTTAIFADKNVGTGKAVSVSGISISGNDATNYSLANTTASTTADITVRSLTVTAAGINKVYDGTMTATVTLSDNKVTGDAVTDAYTTATFADKNVGTGKAVSVSGISISGADANNYSLANTTASTTADIIVRTLTVTATGINKIYDGAMAATVTLHDDKVSGDAVTDAYTTATFADKNVGMTKTVSVSGISISGNDAPNYKLASTTASTIADITLRQLTVTATGVNKVYDGTTMATVNLSDDGVNGDVFTDSYTTATFADKNVGTGKAVSVSGISISGTDAANYALVNTTASTTANITARQLIVTATGVNKVYDGTTAATVTLSDNKVTGDAVTDAYTTATFADANAGVGKTVTVGGISISGADAGNYINNPTATTTATITPYNNCGAYAYNGTMFANTDVGYTYTNVTLSVVITTTGSADASKATVKFYNSSGTTPVCIGTAAVSANSLNQAVYTYKYKIDIGNNNSVTNQISWTISGNYDNTNCDETSTDVTVSARTADFLTGGGYVILNPTTNPETSAGAYKGDPYTKTNFGFNVKWNKSLTNIQGGGLNAIIRGTDPNTGKKVQYQIKGTKINTLSVIPSTSTSPATAAFTGNANFSEFDESGTTLLYSVGNCTLTVEITDSCEPGPGMNTSTDQIAITLKDNNGRLLYSNNWNGSKTVKQQLNGGNLQIHSDANTPAPMCSSALTTVASLKNDMPKSTTSVTTNDLIKDTNINPFSVTVYPNPSPNSFNISMKGGSDEKVDVIVSDVLGHLMKRYRVAPGTSIALGDDFGVGVYIVQVRQGQTFKYYRIYKAPN